MLHPVFEGPWLPQASSLCPSYTDTVSFLINKISGGGLLTSIFRCSSPPRNPVYVGRVDPSTLGKGFQFFPQSLPVLLQNGTVKILLTT